MVARATRVLGWVAAAAVLAALLNPIVEVLARRIRRGFAVALVVLGVVALVAALAWAGVGDLRAGLARLRTVAPARIVQQALLERGFVTGTSNDAHVLRLMPAINTPLAAVQELAAALTDMGETIDETLAATV